MMIGGKVLLTYKRKRPSRRDISLRIGHPYTSAECSNYTSSITADNHEASFEGNKPENSTGYSENAPEGKRLCSDRSQQQNCPVSVKKSSRVEEKSNLICDRRKLMSREGSWEKTLGDLSMDLQREGKSNSMQEVSCSCVNPCCANEDNKPTEKDSVPPCVSLDNGNKPCPINLKSTMERNCSDKCMVTNASGMQRANTSEASNLKEAGLPVQDKPSSLCMSVQSKLISPLITFRRRSKQKKGAEVLQTENTLHARDNCSLASEGCASFLTGCEAMPSENALANLNPSQQNLGHFFHPYQEKRDGRDTDYSCARARLTSEMGSAIKEADKKMGNASKDNPCIDEEVHPNDFGLDLSSVPSKINLDFQGNPIGFSGNSLTNVENNPSCKLLLQTFHAAGKKSPNLSNSDSNTIRMTNEMLASKGPLVSLNLSGPLTDPCDTVDCNVALISGIGEQPIRSSLDSTSTIPTTFCCALSLGDKALELLHEKVQEKESMPQGQKLGNSSSSEDAVGDKSNICGNSYPLLAMKTNYLQLFPENRSVEMTKSYPKVIASADPETVTWSESRGQARNTATKSAPFLGLSLPMELKIDNYACSSAISQWPNVCLQSRGFIQDAVPQYFPDQTSSFLRHKVMLDNIVSRARAPRGHRSSCLDKYDYPTMWSEEELDYLWIGVRRYGRGNWDAMLRDPRLHFSPWRTATDLAEQWEAEQSKLFNSTPISQVRHSRRTNVLQEHLDGFWHPKTGKHVVDDVQLSLGDVYSQPNDSSRKRSLFNVMDAQSNAPRHPPAANMRTMHHSLKGMRRRGRFENHAVLDVESSFSANPTTCIPVGGNLPHWLREVATIPPRPPDAALPSVMSSVAHGMHRVSQPCFDLKQSHPESMNRVSNNLSIPERNELQSGTGTQNGNPPLATAKEKAELHQCNGNKHELIIINSDASSEETISDDHNARS